MESENAALQCEMNDSTDAEYVPEEEAADHETIEDEEPRVRVSRSFVWKYFQKAPSPGKMARCVFCNEAKSYMSTINNLKKHLANKHPRAYKEMKMLSGNKRPSQPPPPPRFKSTVWKYFERVPPHSKRMAKCRVCHKVRSYMTTVTNLRAHLFKVHKDKFKRRKKVTNRTEGEDLSENEADDANADIEQKENDNDDEDSLNQSDSRVNRSAVWSYFKKTKPYDTCLARCIFCLKDLSYKTSITNLRRHLTKQHAKALQRIENDNTEQSLDDSESDESSKLNSKFSKIPKNPNKVVVSMLYEIDEGNEVAKCKLCKEDVNCTRTADLKSHVLRMHSEDIRKLGSAVGGGDSEQREKKIYSRRSKIWQFFEILDYAKMRAACSICSRELSFVSVGNLKKHLVKSHSDIDTVAEFLTPEQGKSYPQNNKTKPQKRFRSSVWKHFDIADEGNKLAACKRCNQKLCYKSVNNLGRHLKRMHGERSSLSVDGDDAEIQEDTTSVWAYFKCLSRDLKLASCLICKKRIDYNDYQDLCKHLSKKHPEVEVNTTTAKPRKLMITRNGDIYEIDEDIAKQEPETVEEVNDDDSDDWPYNNDDETDALDTTEYLDEKIFSPVKSVPVKKLRISHQQTNTLDDKQSVRQNGYQKTSSEDSSLDIFGKYIVSLLKNLPKQKSDKLQVEFVRQIMEAQMDSDSAGFTIEAEKAEV